jgi:hypothetical protein
MTRMGRFLPQVQMGAHKLDQENPGWRKQINLKKLNIKDFCDCILGQLYGSFDQGYSVLFGRCSPAELIAHGFAMADVNYADELTMEWRLFLDPEWKNEID